MPSFVCVCILVYNFLIILCVYLYYPQDYVYLFKLIKNTDIVKLFLTSLIMFIIIPLTFLLQQIFLFNDFSNFTISNPFVIIVLVTCNPSTSYGNIQYSKSSPAFLDTLHHVLFLNKLYILVAESFVAVCKRLLKF